MEPAGDVEAPVVSATNDRLGQQAAAEGPAIVETGLAEPDATAAAASADVSPISHRTPSAASNLPFFALGFTATVALLFIISDIIINHSIHPATTGVFLLLSLCWVILKRHTPSTSSEASSGRPNTLTKEAREELLTYFVFAGPETETETGALEGAETNGTGHTIQQIQQQQHGKETSGGRDVLQESRTSNRSSGSGGSKEWSASIRGWRWMGSSNIDDGEAGAGGRGNPFDADHTDDAGPLPAGTAGPSPCPASPCVLPPIPSEQLFDLDVVGMGCVLSSADAQEGAVAAGAGAGAGAGDATGVARVVRELPEKEEEKEQQQETPRQVERRDSGQPRSSGPAPFDGRDPTTETSTSAGATTAASATARAPATTCAAAGTVEDENDAATMPPAIPSGATPDAARDRSAPPATTTSEPVSAPVTEQAMATGAANEESVVGNSDSGEWSTDRACIVCFGDYAAGDLLCRLPCRHVYHAECINEWLDRAKVPCCPLCKTDLLHSGSDAGTTAAAGTGADGGARSRVDVVEVTGENAV